MLQLNFQPLMQASDQGHFEQTAQRACIEEVKDLDAQISLVLRQLNRQTGDDLLYLGQLLVRMQAFRGYRQLGIQSWEAYLVQKGDYKRTYLSYIVRIGRAPGLEAVVPEEMGGSQLIEYARATRFPEKIPDLVAATWSKFKRLPIRELSKQLQAYVAEHAVEYRGQSRQSPADRSSIQRHVLAIERRYRSFENPEERLHFLSALEEFLDARRDELSAPRQGRSRRKAQ